MYTPLLAQAATAGGPSTGAIVGIVVAVLIVLALALWVANRARSRRLRTRFGPEYDRTLQQTGSASRAERELAERERRHRELDIRPLTPGAQSRYADEWRAIQARFVDDPSGAVRDADLLVVQVMRDRGYPVDDPDQRFADLSVEHAGVLDNYREARAIAERNARNQAGTEDLRRATVAYRALFADLLGPAPTTSSKKGAA